jgi:cyclin C
MEFYLTEDIGCDLAVFHPYRTMLVLCRYAGGSTLAGAAHELGKDVHAVEGEQCYWSLGAGRLQLPDRTLQIAWSAVCRARARVC